jgi:hypothetical protein
MFPIRRFKIPLLVTGIALVVALIIVIAVGTYIYQTEPSRRRAMKRAEMLGTGVGVTTSLIVAPFWLVVAGRIGKERREARKAAAAERRQA